MTVAWIPFGGEAVVLHMSHVRHWLRSCVYINKPSEACAYTTYAYDMFTCVYVWMHACMYVCSYVCMYVFMYACMYAACTTA